MRVKDLIREPKSRVVFGGWKSGAMPKSAFPLGRSGKNSLIFRAFDWCALTFSAPSGEYRVVVAVNFEKASYYAHLGAIHGSCTKMLLSYEYHASHGGWHVHAGCGDMDLIPIGRYKGDWKQMIPAAWQACRRTNWDVSNKSSALQRACEAFGIPLPSSDDSRQIELL